MKDNENQEILSGLLFTSLRAALKIKEASCRT